MDIQVVILCGGMGARLREETEHRPKPMIPIGGKPILLHIMKIYSAYGFNNFVLCVGYKGEVIKEYFCNYEILNNDFVVELGRHKQVRMLTESRENGWRVIVADTGENALKGCRIKKIQKYVTGDLFMLTYGDTLADVDVPELLRFHRSHGRIATVTGVRPMSRFGELRVEGNAVASFAEKPQVSGGLINGGFFVLNREIFNYLTEDDSCDFEVGTLNRLVSEGQLMAYEHKREWACMDTFRDMQYLNKLWQEGKAFWKIGRE